MNILEKRLFQNNEMVKYVLCGHLNLLEESKQLIPNIKAYYDVVWKKVSEVTGIKNDRDYLRKNNTERYKIQLTEDDFQGIETLFNKLSLTIDLTITNNIGVYNYKGGYDPQESKVDTSTGKIVPTTNDFEKLPKVVIRGDIKTSVMTIQEAIAACIYHEFTHAYEDLERIRENKENSLAAYTIYSNYGGINAIKLIVPPYGEKLGNIVYLLKRVETNAYVSQTIGEIEVKTKWANEMIEAIKSTIGYKNYEWLLSAIKSLENVDNLEIQDILLKAFNANAGIIGKYNGKNKRYLFKNYNQMIKFLKKKTIYTYNHFVDKLSRHFEDNQIRNKFTIH